MRSASERAFQQTGNNGLHLPEAAGSSIMENGANMLISNNTTMIRRARQLLRSVCMVIALGSSIAAGPARAEEAWFLLEFADSKPPCANADPADRCYGTQPELSRFEIRDGERIVMPRTGQVPPAWAEFNRMWVYAPAAVGGTLNRSIELAATPIGARLIIQDQGRQYLKSVELNRWVALEDNQQPTLWVKVTESRF